MPDCYFWYPRGAVGFPTPPPPLPPLPLLLRRVSGGRGLTASQIGAAAGLTARIGTFATGLTSHLATTIAPYGAAAVALHLGAFSALLLYIAQWQNKYYRKKRGHQTPWVWEAQEHNACEASSLLVLLLSSARSSLLGTCTAAYVNLGAAAVCGLC